MASGKQVDKNALEAAHRTPPVSTMLKATNVKNLRSVVVRVLTIEVVESATP